MTDDEYHPELDGYEPGEVRPPQSVVRKRVMRIIGALGLTALVLPGLLVTIRVQGSTAAASCGYVVATQDPDAVDYRTRFELGPDGPGWYCYAVRFGGSEILLRFLGLIPGLSPQRDESPAIPA